MSRGETATCLCRSRCKLNQTNDICSRTAIYALDAAGNTFVAASLPDAAGKDAPFPNGGWVGCGADNGPISCSDVAVYKYSAQGALTWVTYLVGNTTDTAGFLQLAADGALVVAGNTDSADFPVTPTALQPAFAGPAPTFNSRTFFKPDTYFRGDVFAVKLDSVTGLLRAATFLGGPRRGQNGGRCPGNRWISLFHPCGAICAQRSNAGDAWLAAGGLCGGPVRERLCSAPQSVAGPTAVRHLLAGQTAEQGEAPFRWQPLLRRLCGGGVSDYAHGIPTAKCGKDDVFVARLDPSGSRFLFATYLGGAVTDWFRKAWQWLPMAASGRQ